MTATLTDTDWAVRGAIYRHFVATTEAPSTSDLEREVGISTTDIGDSLQRLDASHQIALAPGTPNIWMANPFSSIPTEFPAETAKARYWANCAWDAVGVPAILDADSWTRTRCQESGQPIEFGVRNGRLETTEAVIHIAVPAKEFYDNIGFT